MARGVEVIAPLPKVSFVKIDDETLSKPAGVSDNTVRGFGCECVYFVLWAISRVSASDNDGSEFQRPEHYIRYSGRQVVSLDIPDLANIVSRATRKGTSRAS